MNLSSRASAARQAGTRAARTAAVARCGWGIACLSRPGPVVRLTGAAADRDACWFTRILGGREVLQGALTLARPTRTVLAAGIAVDVLHALSLLGLAAVDPRRRRPALLNASTATAWALLGRALVRPSRLGP